MCCMGGILFKASNMVCAKHRNMYLGPLGFLMPSKNVLVGGTSNSWRTLALHTWQYS